MPASSIDDEIFRAGVSYQMGHLNDMPFDAEVVTNPTYYKIPVEPKEHFFDVSTIKKVVELEELVQEIRAKHNPNDMVLFVQSFAGKTVELNLNADYKVEEVKILIHQQEGWVPSVQRLLHLGKQMADRRTLKDYNITDRSLIHMTLCVRGGCRAYELEKDYFDPKWNSDLTTVWSDELPFFRGGYPYTRPLGSMRYALKVLGKYENDDWIGAFAERKDEHNSVDNEWPVAYHGTTDLGAAEIVRSGGLKLEKCVHFKHGYGIYCSPNPETALRYAPEYNYKGQWYKLIIQVRVDPARRNIHGDFWIAKEDDAIRPYGICVYPY